MQNICVTCLPSDVRPTLWRQMYMGSSTWVQIWVRAVHTKGAQAQTSLHKSWLGGSEKLAFTLARQGIEPRVFGFEFRTLTTELRLSFIINLRYSIPANAPTVVFKWPGMLQSVAFPGRLPRTVGPVFLGGTVARTWWWIVSPFNKNNGQNERDQSIIIIL